MPFEAEDIIFSENYEEFIEISTHINQQTTKSKYFKTLLANHNIGNFNK